MLIIPIKVSRPGCDIEDICYIPSNIVVEKGKSVTWLNEDSSFHSVTSGFYPEPSGLFDSGHLDPYQSYTLSFDEIGTYDYFCTLTSLDESSSNCKVKGTRGSRTPLYKLCRLTHNRSARVPF